MKIAVTFQEYDKARIVFEGHSKDGVEYLRAPEKEGELAEFILKNQVSHAIVGLERYANELYGAVPKGGVLARFGIGHDGIDKAKATAHGVICTNTPGVLDDSVAEHAIALLLAISRNIPELCAKMKAGEWAPKMGCELKGKTLAIIGCGAIGKKIAKIASFGLDMNVFGCETSACDAEEMRRLFGFSKVSQQYDEAVNDADFVSINIPSTPATYHYIDAVKLSSMKQSAWLINTARGNVVDEAALYDALTGGIIAGAAIDVFEKEPYTPQCAEKDLRELPNVILTPHVGSSTFEASARIAMGCICNIEHVMNGRFDSMNVLNPEVLEKHS